MNLPLWRQLWAKSDPRHPLWCHLLDVAAVCRALLPGYGGLAELPNDCICLLVGLHDLGKAHGHFQNKDAGLAEELRGLGLEIPTAAERYRHEFCSAEWVAALVADYPGSCPHVRGGGPFEDAILEADGRLSPRTGGGGVDPLRRRDPLGRCTCPHVRGGGPRSRSGANGKDHLSPRTWGWTDQAAFSEAHVALVPTYVGVDRGE